MHLHRSGNQRLRNVVVAFGALIAMAGRPAAASCGGDCNGDGAVSVDEILKGVNIALGSLDVTSCNNFDANVDASVTVDEIVAAVVAALEGCPAGQQQAFVVVTNFTSGSFGTISLDPPRTTVPGSSARQIHPDAIARQHDGLVYVVNRFMGDNVESLDPADGYSPRMQCVTGALTNPHDIAFVSNDKAYVTLYDKSEILIVDPTPGADCAGFIRGRIDVSAYADRDGLPEVDMMAIVGDRLYVTLEKLDRENFFVPAGPGGVLVIDTTTDVIQREITLSAGNPFSQTNGLVVWNDSLMVGEVNEFGKNDGGIERVDLATSTATGFIVTEETLGGDVTDFVLVSGTVGYAIISLPDFTNAIVKFDPSTGEKTGTLLSGGSYADIEVNDRGELWVAQSTFGSAGIRIFRVSDEQEVTATPIDLTLPPFSILFF